MSAWIGLALISMALAAVGQFMWKLGARAMGSFSLVAVLRSPYVWGGLVLFGVSSLIWMKVLTRAPLSVAYPITALSYLVVLGLSRLVLHEAVTPLKAIGILTIFVGVGLVGVGSQSGAHPAGTGVRAASAVVVEAERPRCARSRPAQVVAASPEGPCAAESAEAAAVSRSGGRAGAGGPAERPPAAGRNPQ